MIMLLVPRKNCFYKSGKTGGIRLQNSTQYTIENTGMNSGTIANIQKGKYLQHCEISTTAYQQGDMNAGIYQVTHANLYKGE